MDWWLPLLAESIVSWLILLIIVVILTLPTWLPIVARPFQEAAQRRHDKAVRDGYQGRKDNDDTTESS